MIPNALVLRRLLDSGEKFIVPGAYDALTARLVEAAGFPCVYATGAGISNSQLALADVGLLTMTEMLDQVRKMTAAIERPLICDIDTGYGNAVNLSRAVWEFIRAGAAAVQIEDQVMPKKCGHFEGKRLIPFEESVLKIKAAVEARGDSGLVIVARTDAIAVEGLGEALKRAVAYHQAGADMVFVEAPRTTEEMQEICRVIECPKIINIVEGGKTPIVEAKALHDMGFNMILYANLVLRSSAKAIETNLRHLLERGDTSDILDSIVSVEERAAATRKPLLDDIERRYVTLADV